DALDGHEVQEHLVGGQRMRENAARFGRRCFFRHCGGPAATAESTATGSKADHHEQFRKGEPEERGMRKDGKSHETESFYAGPGKRTRFSLDEGVGPCRRTPTIPLGCSRPKHRNSHSTGRSSGLRLVMAPERPSRVWLWEALAVVH